MMLFYIYPAISFEKSTSILSSMESRELLSNTEKRKELAKYYTLKNHVQTGDPSTFLCCAADDMTIHSSQVCEYANGLKKYGVPFELHVFAQGGHEFGACKSEQTGMIKHDRQRTSSWCELFVAWANHIFDGKEEENPYAAFVQNVTE